jgi:hypothetical protein
MNKFYVHKLHMVLPVMLLCVPAFSQNFGRTANGELALRAFQKSFPGKAGEVSFIDNDWTISAGGETFFWADGRLLPQAERDQTDSYAPHLFYIIPDKPASPDSYPPQYVEALRTRNSEVSRYRRIDSHRVFQGILYGGLTRAEIERNIEKIEFLDHSINVHRDIAGALKRIDAEIKNWNDAQLFIDSIGSIGGYNWREIAGTQRMSYHSWGLAVDIQPKRLGGLSMYWQWERERNDDWMLVPLEKRWNPPDPVIAAFEREGFVWGGKWPFFDNMHFEYRPELYEFSRLMADDSGIGSAGRELHHIAPDLLFK